MGQSKEDRLRMKLAKSEDQSRRAMKALTAVKRICGECYLRVFIAIGNGPDKECAEALDALRQLAELPEIIDGKINFLTTEQSRPWLEDARPGLFRRAMRLFGIGDKA